MRASLNEIRDAARCMAYYRFSKRDPLIKPLSNIDYALPVIQKAYLQAAETKFRPDWRRIVGWVDKLVFVDADINDEKSFEFAKTRTEQILSFVRAWYDKIFLIENHVGYADLALELELGKHQVTGVIPIVKDTDPLTIVTIDDVVQANFELYNDIKVRGECLLLADKLDLDKIQYQRFTMGPRGGFSEQTIHVDKVANERTRNRLSEIVTVMNLGTKYPSVSTHCESCPFKRRCVI